MLLGAVRKTSCVLFGMFCLLMGQVAHAADEEAESKRLYAKGIAAQQAGDQKTALAAFAAAWKLRPHYKIAANLGAVESELGLHREAAAHLDAAIALYREGEKTGGTVDQNKLDTLEAMRKAATRYVVSFSAIATFDGQVVGGGELFVDDVSLGPNELGKVYYLLPGERTIVVRAPGVASVRQGIMGAEDQAMQFELSLWPDGVGRLPGEEASSSSPMSLGAIVGIAASVVVPAVVGGVGLALANGASAEVTALENDISAIAVAPSESPFLTCVASTPECDAWRGARARRTDFMSLAAGGFAVAGGAAIAGAMYALWPSPTAMQAAVSVGPGQAGWTLRGSF